MGDLEAVERAWTDEVNLLNESNEQLAKALRALLEAIGDLRGEKSWAWHAITEAEGQARAALQPPYPPQLRHSISATEREQTSTNVVKND